MREQAGRVLVDAVRAGAFQLLLAVAAGEYSDTDGARTASCEEVPHAVTDDDRIVNRDAELFGGGEKQVGIGLGVADLIARNDDQIVAHAEHFERSRGALPASAGGNGVRDAIPGEIVEQLHRSWQRTYLAHVLQIRFGMPLNELLGVDGLRVAAGLARQGVDQKAAAHPYAPVNLPDGEIAAAAFESLTPGEHVLVHA